MNFVIQRTNMILYCQNWSETVNFYRHILGLDCEYLADWFVEFRLSNESYISVADENRATLQSAKGQGITLSWRVHDIAAAHQTLKIRGVDVGDIESKWGSRAFIFYDPEGNRIECWG